MTFCSGCCRSARTAGSGRSGRTRRRARCKALPTPGPLVSRWPIPSGIPGGRQPALPSSRVAPVSTCPALRPRWCLEDFAIPPPRLLPSSSLKPSAFPPSSRQEVILMTTTFLHCRVTWASYPAQILTRSGLGDFHHPAPPPVRLAATFPISGQKYGGVGADNHGASV